MAKGAKKAKAGQVKERHERRFIPRPTSSPVLVNVLGGVAAAALGAGSWAQFGREWTDNPLPPHGFAPVLIAAGAVLFGAAVWLGTSGELPVRVGDGGIAIDKGKEVTRIPWYEVERIVWDPDRQALSVQGKDETGRVENLTLTSKAQAAAIAWIVKEARGRIPEQVDVPEEALGLPEALPGDGERLVMDAVQVVGKRCAASDRVIAYEPDARVCPRCERVYYKESVPETCACGASLAAQRVSESAS
jgi:hypothetical protein